MSRGPQLRFEAFNEALLIESFGSRETIRYLNGYLTDLTATSVLIEQRYVDRHFVDDFAAYYARSFSPPTTPCRRLHFFKSLSAEELQRHAATAVVDRDETSSKRILRDAYLGFAVWRPLVGASLGRTV